MNCDAPTKACKRQTFWLAIWNPFQDFLSILIFVINYCKTNWSDRICSQIVFSISNGLFKQLTLFITLLTRSESAPVWKTKLVYFPNLFGVWHETVCVR